MMVKFNDNSEKAMAMLQVNARAALSAMGEEAVGAILKQMESGYSIAHKNRSNKYKRVFGVRLKNENYNPGSHTAIRDTGTLMGSIAHAPSGEMTEDVGTNVSYAKYVHDGTSKMEGRPFIKDGIEKGSARIKKICMAYLKKGFE